MVDKQRDPDFIIGAIEKAVDAVIILCLIILGAALPILFLWVSYLEVSTWLMSGNWAALSLGKLMPPVTSEMVGLQKIVDWLYGLSVLIPLAVASVIMWGVCMRLAEYSFGHRR
jgi:hypothetical protein